MPPPYTNELEQRAYQVIQGIPGVLEPLRQPLNFTSLEHADDVLHTEAIVFDVGRPALFISNGQVSAVKGPPWQAWFEKHGAKVSATSYSVGRVSVAGLSPRPVPATAFLVSPDVVLTCQHVLNTFTTGLPGNRKLRTGAKPSINFKAEFGLTGSVEVPIIGVLGEHPTFDAVLLRIHTTTPLAPPLAMANAPWSGSQPRPVFVIGHPAALNASAEPIYHQIFSPPYDLKRVSPGLATLRSSTPLLFHDASTWEGNSGSAVIDFETGVVVGLHFGGAFHVENRAVPVWNLKADSFAGGDMELA
jgi:endonuclease G